MSSISAGVASPSDGLICFVCDGTVVGRYYNLASCKTQVTKQRLVDKLGQLVGEQYMVVISEDDIICRSCNTMLNNLDRLEKEMSSVRSVIQRFLEKKYELDEGELANTPVVLPPPMNQPELLNAFKKTESPITFKERKKQSAAAATAHQISEKESNSNVWMQCDRCKYTTPYSSFMINHIHRHSEAKVVEEKQEAIEEDEPQDTTDDGGTEGEHYETTEISEVVEALAPSMEEAVITNGEEVTNGEVEEGAPEDSLVEMDMGDSDGDGTVCMVDENGVLQKVQQGEDGQFYVVDGDIDGSKQMISVAEDGSVQMVQVMWDDVAADDNIQF